MSNAIDPKQHLKTMREMSFNMSPIHFTPNDINAIIRATEWTFGMLDQDELTEDEAQFKVDLTRATTKLEYELTDHIYTLLEHLPRFSDLGDVKGVIKDLLTYLTTQEQELYRRINNSNYMDAEWDSIEKVLCGRITEITAGGTEEYIPDEVYDIIIDIEQMLHTIIERECALKYENNTSNE